jgi:hypothetical protein
MLPHNPPHQGSFPKTSRIPLHRSRTENHPPEPHTIPIPIPHTELSLASAAHKHGSKSHQSKPTHRRAQTSGNLVLQKHSPVVREVDEFGKRGRTRTVVPIIAGQDWVVPFARPVAGGRIKLGLEKDRALLSGKILGIREPERKAKTPELGTSGPISGAEKGLGFRIGLSSGREGEWQGRIASPRGTPRAIRSVSPILPSAPDSANDHEDMKLGIGSWDKVEGEIELPMQTPHEDHQQSVPDLSKDTESETEREQEIRGIEEELCDAMENSLELGMTEDEVERVLCDPEDLGDRSETIRIKGKRKGAVEGEEEGRGYPDKKGKLIGLDMDMGSNADENEDMDRTVRGRAVNTISVRQEKKYRRPISFIKRDSSLALPSSANIYAEATIISRPVMRESNSQTIHSESPLKKRPSIDHLIKGLEPIDPGPTPSNRFWTKRERPERRGTLPTVLRAPTPQSRSEQKARPSLVKQITDVLLSPKNGTISLDENSEPEWTEAERNKTACISLKRIQDDDMERIMHSYQTQSRSHSPASQLEAIYKAERAQNGTIDSQGMSWETLHKRNVMDRARCVGNEWMKAGNRKSIDTLPRSPVKPSDSSDRPRGHLRERSISYAVPSPTKKMFSAQSNEKMIRRQSDGEHTLMHTRWDGSKTPLNEQDHPAHYAALLEHRLKRQRSKQSLKAARNSTISTQDVFGMDKDRETESDRYTPSSMGAPPVAIERWRSQLGHVSGSRNPYTRSSTRQPPPGPDSSRSHHRQNKTQPLSLDLTYSRPSSYPRSCHSQESCIPQSACSVSSFDAKTAYDQVKTEAGYVSFDQILGLKQDEETEEETTGRMESPVSEL